MAPNVNLKNGFGIIPVTCVIMVWLVKLFIRPYFSFPYPVKFLLGIAPNFLDGFLLPFAITWARSYIPVTLSKYGVMVKPERTLRYSCLLTFLFLILVEGMQLFSFSMHTYDHWDIAASAVGVALAYHLILLSGQAAIMSYGRQ
jgi:hypothetical protein